MTFSLSQVSTTWPWSSLLSPVVATRVLIVTPSWPWSTRSGQTWDCLRLMFRTVGWPSDSAQQEVGLSQGWPKYCSASRKWPARRKYHFISGSTVKSNTYWLFCHFPRSGWPTWKLHHPFSDGKSISVDLSCFTRPNNTFFSSSALANNLGSWATVGHSSSLFSQR